MSQKEYLNSSLQIIYDMTILDTTDASTATANEPRSQSLMLFPINIVQFH